MSKFPGEKSSDYLYLYTILVGKVSGRLKTDKNKVQL